MAKPIGTIYAELDLDTTKYTAAQKKILYDSQTLAINQENSWKVLGQKSDVMYAAMRKQAENAYLSIASRAKEGSAEQVRAEEAKNAKIKSLNEQQFGHQTSLLESLKKNWMAVSATAVAAYMVIQRTYSFIRDLASAGNEIERMSHTLNMTTDDFQKWSYVAKMADIDVQGFGDSFKFLTRSMGEALQGTGDSAKAFELLGINLKNATGRTKDQQTVMMETIGALEKYAEGVNRDALMLAIFGRGWMSIKPLIDQGTKAIEENRRESERLNLILGKDLVKSLSESEDAYKRWEAVWKVSKMEFWTPMVRTFTDLLEKILALKTAFREGGFKGLWEKAQEHEMEAMEEQAWKFYGGPSERVKSWVSGWTPTVIKKPEAPALPSAQASKELQKMLEDEAKAYGDFAQSAISDLEKLNQVLNELSKAEREERIKNEKYANDQIIEGQKEFDKEFTEAWDATNQMYVDIYRRRTEQVENIVGSISQNISDVWATNMSKMITDATSWKDAMNNIWKGMADAFVSAIMKMIVNWVLFGNITGQKSAGGGYGGIVGSVVSLIGLLEEGGILPGSFIPIRQFAYGGIADRPTFGLIGENREPEAVIPLKGGAVPVQFTGEKKDQSGIQSANIFQIICMDPISWRDFVRRNPEAIIEAISKDARGAGAMRGTIKGVG